MLLLTSIENWDGLVQEIFNEVIPAGEAEWREGRSVGSHKIFDIGDILRFTLLIKMHAMSTCMWNGWELGSRWKNQKKSTHSRYFDQASISRDAEQDLSSVRGTKIVKGSKFEGYRSSRQSRSWKDVPNVKVSERYTSNTKVQCFWETPSQTSEERTMRTRERGKKTMRQRKKKSTNLWDIYNN